MSPLPLRAREGVEQPVAVEPWWRRNPSVFAWLGATVSVSSLTPALRWASKRDTNFTFGTVATRHGTGLMLLAGAVAALPALVGGAVGRRWFAVVIGLVCITVAGLIELALAVITWPAF